jgi:hypothetical protein
MENKKTAVENEYKELQRKGDPAVIGTWQRAVTLVVENLSIAEREEFMKAKDTWTEGSLPIALQIR